MFCALKGATLKPRFLRIRQSAAVITVLPTCEAVPWIMTGFAERPLFFLVFFIAAFFVVLLIRGDYTRFGGKAKGLSTGPGLRMV
jgi:hypothetical protein